MQVKGPLNMHLELSVDGRVLPQTQVGKKSSLEKTQALAWEDVGVDFKPGRNVLRVRAVDQFGNERGSAEIMALVPGPLARISSRHPPRRWPMPPRPFP